MRSGYHLSLTLLDADDRRTDAAATAARAKEQSVRKKRNLTLHLERMPFVASTQMYSAMTAPF